MSQPARIRLGDREIDYLLKRSRRRTIGFTISHAGLAVTVPQRVSQREIEGALHARSGWILDKLAAWEERPRRAVLALESGETLPWLGGELALQIEPRGGRTTVTMRGDTLHVTVDPQAAGELRDRAIRSALVRFYKREGAAFMTPRVESFASALSRPVRKVIVREQKSRWGSCASDGTIRLNWRLMGFPETMIDYVCAHEAAHLVEANHSAAFWNTLASVLPDWREARAAMRSEADRWTWS
jgi:predicted metal-dependent hydrolase